MRVALHSVIRESAVDDYRAHHARVPEELVALFERAGIHDWVIWRSGDRLFHLVDCDHWDDAMTVVGADPANERWQADIGRFVAVFHTADGADGFAPIEEVWSLAGQRSEGATA
ncbi:L-rhamnose mutarotase [Microbacterium sp. 4R-513]|uniref:L-rhamnose mutarotase n=1 Tax=Microbacterium sp. 4R-513 TaxID=2567934 RepID=UPI0013E1D3B8|nr:L-rhamnose mutarotase [Microbacterium sp. 4R-513]QIG39421.1 L-rhamnose mutarotase [Microbacterium sp. 4R-513]